MNRGPDTRASLLMRIRKPRDERAWVEFEAIYEPLVYQLARRKGFQDADAHELTQEALPAVAHAIERWDPDPARGSFRGVPRAAHGPGFARPVASRAAGGERGFSKSSRPDERRARTTRLAGG